MERIIAEMIRRLDPARFEAHVLAIRYFGHFSQGLDEFATLHLMPPASRLSMLRPATLARQIRAIAPDIVHTHSGVWYKASRAARMGRVARIVYTDHGRQLPDPWLFRTLDGLASRRTDAVIAVSDALASQLSHIVASPSQISVIRNGVDTTRNAPGPPVGTLHRELGIPSDTPLLGSVGRLELVKGYDVMLQALAALLRDWTTDLGRPPSLVLIGNGRQRATLEALAQELGIAQSVHFAGWRTDIETVLREFTLFTMSSHSEGTSVSLLEAMSTGLCPVVTDVGGNRVALGPALAHRLVPPAAPAALADAWRHALTDLSARENDGAAARAQVVNMFSLDAMVRQYEVLYETLIDRTP
jgi:glycosyltransferase involved in cell wall biosynthesis